MLEAADAGIGWGLFVGGLSAHAGVFVLTSILISWQVSCDVRACLCENLSDGRGGDHYYSFGTKPTLLDTHPDALNLAVGADDMGRLPQCHHQRKAQRSSIFLHADILACTG